MERKTNQPVAAMAWVVLRSMIQCGGRGCCGCCGCLSFHVTIFFWYVRIGFRFFSQSSPSAKISGQRTGLRFFSQSSPSAKISDQRIRPRGTSQLDPDSGFPAAIEKKPLSFKIPFKTDKFFAEARPLVFGRLGYFDFAIQSLGQNFWPTDWTTIFFAIQSLGQNF